jgi:hypothetical protein
VARAAPTADRSPKPLLIAAGLAFLLISWSPYHHWDEFFYLFSAMAHTPRDLVRYEAGLGIFPNGFFSGKIAHVVLLRLLLKGLGAGRGSLFVIQAFYACMMLAFAAAGWGVLRELLDKRIALRSTVVLLFLPVTTYLGFKTLSEVPSLLFTTAASWAFLVSFRESTEKRRRYLLALSAVGIALGALSRVTSLLAFAGLILGILAMQDHRLPWTSVLRRAAVVTAGALLLYLFFLYLAGGSPLRLTHLAYTVATHDVWMQRLYALALALQAFLLVIPFGVRVRNGPMMRLILVWLGVAALPFLAGHESRYYATALIPLAVLCGLGVSRVAERILGRGRPWGWIGILAVLALADRALFAPLMPYEIDQTSLNRAISDLQRPGRSGTILVPWISDYAYLRVVFPDQPVRLAISAIPGARYTAQGRFGPMAPEDQWWAGPERYVGSWDRLRREPQPWYYVGWDYAPSLISLRQALGAVGVTWAHNPLKAGWHNHLAASWIWQNPQLSLTPAGREGQYQIFRIGQATQTSPGSTLPAPR